MLGTSPRLRATSVAALVVVREAMGMPPGKMSLLVVVWLVANGLPARDGWRLFPRSFCSPISVSDLGGDVVR